MGLPKALLLKNKTTPIDAYESDFQQNDYDPVFIPLIQHKHLPTECLNLLKDEAYLSQLQTIVISSQRTVECLNESIIPNLSEYQRKALLQKTVYTVGPATANFLQRCGFTNIRGGEHAGSGSILAELIISDLGSQAIEFSKVPSILLLVGETRRDIVPKRLTSVGITSQEVVTYKTQVQDDNLARFKLHFSPQCWVVFFSPQGTEEIIEYLKDQEVNIASIGPTTNDFLCSRNVHSKVVSCKPEPKALVQALKLA
ncbi:LAME_0C04676g1_1 [Lachancea meyersii CBS 8951]|uniref:LAME_0C04676g1_1 n=1 Tax=Lachancea meyersii CBS 8951 TaxID=1266667 RepID=A0A1G4J1H3_9SACH|nr:LAME_0C04676g1_1 [Lachancea meyersii CBS 8951]